MPDHTYATRLLSDGTEGEEVRVTDASIREARWVSEYEVRQTVDEAVAEAIRETLENVWEYGIKSSLDELLRAAELGTLENVCSYTDILLHGDTVAGIRAAIDIVADHVKEQGPNA